MVELRGRCWSALLSGAIGQRSACVCLRRVVTMISKGERRASRQAQSGPSQWVNVGADCGRPCSMMMPVLPMCLLQRPVITEFGQDISRVIPAQHLSELNISRTHVVLNPQIGYGKMPYLAGSSAAASADCCSCVCQHGRIHLQGGVSA